MKLITKRDNKELLNLFERYPQYHNEDKPRRFLLRAAFRTNKIDFAEKYFKSWPEGKMTQSTREVMVRKMSQVSLEKAIDIFADCLLVEGEFKRAITIQDINQNQKYIKIDFHNTKQNQFGGQGYGGDKDHVIAVKLWYLYGRVLEKMDRKQVVNIQLIPGQGTQYTLRDFVCNILKTEFKWPHTAKGGQIEISGTVESLCGSNIQKPLRIDETTPNYIHERNEEQTDNLE